MNKFLITYYPLKPWRAFLCFEMNDEIQNDKKSDAYILYKEYRRGLDRRNAKDGDLFFYNNSSWLMVEADTAFLAIEKFYERMKEEAKKK